MSHSQSKAADNLINQTQLQSTDSVQQSLIEIAEQALSFAKKMGATSAEISLSQGQGFSATVRSQEVETIEHNRDKSLGVTVFFGSRSGNVSSTDFGETALQQSIQAACNIARYTEKDAFNGLAARESLATEFPDLELYHPWSLSIDDACGIAADCESAALNGDSGEGDSGEGDSGADDSRITNTEGATVSSHDGVDVYANSHGFVGLSKASRHSISCAIIAGEGDAMQRDYWYDSCRDSANLESAEQIGKVTAARTLRRLGARKVKTGEYPVIFEPSIAASLLSHLVAAISGGSLYRKASFLLDKLGHQIFPEYINIFEQPYLSKAAGSAAFDSEGVQTRANEFIKNGVLNSYILSSYSARKLQMESTANAGGVHNLTLSPTMEGGLAEMIANLQCGVVVSELIGFGVNNVTGDYSRGAFGFWVENGVIQYPVQEFTIAGNLKQIFMDIESVGADINRHRSTRTGAIKIKQLTVAGQ